MFKLEIDDRAFVKSMSALETKQLPFATVGALNDSMFDVHRGWGDALREDLENPTPTTQKSALYIKATKQAIEAFVYVRSEASKGTPPARFLNPVAKGGARDEKPFEFLLRKAGVISDGEFVVPTSLAPRDAYGNVPAGVIRTILSDLQAARDPLTFSTPATRAKRARKKNIGKRSVYFVSRGPGSTIKGEKLQHLPRGIYARTAFGSRSEILMIFAVVSGAPRYTKLVDLYGIAQQIFSRSFPVRFRERMALALRTARIK